MDIQLKTRYLEVDNMNFAVKASLKLEQLEEDSYKKRLWRFLLSMCLLS